MNIETQMEPGPGANGALASATLDDLFKEIKMRCTAVAIVVLAEDDDGETTTLISTLGPSTFLLGAVEEVKYKLLHRGEPL